MDPPALAGAITTSGSNFQTGGGINGGDIGRTAGGRSEAKLHEFHRGGGFEETTKRDICTQSGPKSSNTVPKSCVVVVCLQVKHPPRFRRARAPAGQDYPELSNMVLEWFWVFLWEIVF